MIGKRKRRNLRGMHHQGEVLAVSLTQTVGNFSQIWKHLLSQLIHMQTFENLL